MKNQSLLFKSLIAPVRFSDGDEVNIPQAKLPAAWNRP